MSRLNRLNRINKIKTTALLVLTLLVIMATICGGCLATTKGQDYSSYYNSICPRNVTLVKPFYKTTGADVGNVEYLGTIRTPNGRITNVRFDHVYNECDAQAIMYHTATKAMLVDGYTEAKGNWTQKTVLVNGQWQGYNRTNHIYCCYYLAGKEVGTTWVVLTEFS